jgi:hypothetical protein
VLSFGYLFFAQAKKSDSHFSAKAFALSLFCSCLKKAKAKAFALSCDLLFFARPKKSKQKKGRPTVRPPDLKGPENPEHQQKKQQLGLAATTTAPPAH